MTAFADMERLSPALLRHSYEFRGKACWQIWFKCPGCRDAHAVNDGWQFNGDSARPTFTPSILTWHDPNPQAREEPYISGRRCHSYITDGQIQFLNDCTHALAGQTVPLPDWDSAGFDP